MHIENTLLAKLRTHTTHHKNGSVVADLYQTRLGDYHIIISFEDLDGVQMATVNVAKNALAIWEDLVK